MTKSGRSKESIFASVCGVWQADQRTSRPLLHGRTIRVEAEQNGSHDATLASEGTHMPLFRSRTLVKLPGFAQVCKEKGVSICARDLYYGKLDKHLYRSSQRNATTSHSQCQVGLISKPTANQRPRSALIYSSPVSPALEGC